jgi:hypothetical protein
MSTDGPRRRLPRKIVFVVAVTAVALCVAEVLLRWLAPINLAGIQSAYVYDDELGIRLAEDLQATQLSDHLQEIRTNPAGTANFQDSFESYGARIFALGDSYTQGTGLPADASYPFQLDLRLNIGADGLYRPSYAVVNLGLAAYGPEQSLIALRRYRKSLGAPRVCLYLGSENDFSDDILFRSGYRHRHVVRGSPHWGLMTGPLLWASRFELVKRFKMALSQWRRRDLAATGSAAAEDSPRDRASVAERTWPVIEKIVKLCGEQGAVTILGWAADDSASYAWLQARAAAEGVGFADWRPSVESVQRTAADIPLANPHSGGHWRTWVNRLIADAFAREIEHLESAEGKRAP